MLTISYSIYNSHSTVHQMFLSVINVSDICCEICQDGAQTGHQLIITIKEEDMHVTVKGSIKVLKSKCKGQKMTHLRSETI